MGRVLRGAINEVDLWLSSVVCGETVWGVSLDGMAMEWEGVDLVMMFQLEYQNASGVLECGRKNLVGLCGKTGNGGEGERWLGGMAG